MGTKEIREDTGNGTWNFELAYDNWVSLPVLGPRPPARYKHAAAVVNEKLYVIGGSRNGRYLSDVQVLDLRGLAWSSLTLKSEDVNDLGDSPHDILLATSDHSVITWGNKLLLLGGHSKKSSDTMIVWFIDLEKHSYGIMETSGKVPTARGGHSASLFGTKLIIFGGEDRKRRLMNDVHILDLETMTWNAIDAIQTPPAPRFDHTAAVHSERYLFIFGGCSHSVFFNDLHVLDLQSMEWSQPQIQGDLVTTRAGHAGITIHDNWYIVGGGDNRNGCPQTLVLNMSKLAWSVLTSVKERDPLASEGLSVCAALINGEHHLVAFGGYNGKYNCEVFVMRLKSRDSSRPKIFQSPAAAAAAASVTAAYALSKIERHEFPILTTKKVENGLSKQEKKQALEVSLAQVRTENSRLSEKIDEVKTTHDELSKELLSVQGQLVAERSRCFKLEAQIAELQKRLESMQSIENEVQSLRSQRSALEQEIELGKAAVEKQGSGSVWRWISG